MASYHVRYALASGGVYGWEVNAVITAHSADDAWQDACATLDDLIPRFDDRNLEVARVKSPDKTPAKKKPDANKE